MNVIFYFVVLFHLIYFSDGERTKDKMYIPIKSSTGCYRRMNATHQIGCSSKRGGSTGVIHYCDKSEDIDFILHNGNAGQYIPVIPTKFFTREVVQKLNSSEKITGLIIHKCNETVPQYFTHEDQCPNDRFGIKNTCTKDSLWNPHGTGLLYMNINFPIFFVEDDDDVGKIKDCFEKFNNFDYDFQNERPLCSLQLNSFMYGATSTPTCKRRSNKESNINPVKFCDPLGDYNIWSSLYPLVTIPKMYKNGNQIAVLYNQTESKPIENVKYIVVAARLDTTSMFEKTAGAQSPVTGIVTLLSIAKYLKTILPENPDISNNVLFILFNGETYDYIGSQRMLYDMMNGDFPIKSREQINPALPTIHPEDIGFFIEISQLRKTDTVYMHHWTTNEEVSNFLVSLNANSVGVSFTEVSNSLPPSSLHTFLKNNTDLAGLILSDHQTSFSNNFYNSIYDNSSNIGYKYYNLSESNVVGEIPDGTIQRHLAAVTTAVAKAIYQKLKKGEQYSGAETVDVILIDELLYCYLENPNCKVHKAISISKLQNKPISLYVGVDSHNGLLAPVVALTLGWFTGDHVGDGNINCTNKPRNYAYKFYNMSESIYNLNTSWCYRITFNQTEAVSPAFLIDDYDWSSGMYSTWSESTWEDMSMRIFLKPSPAHENMTIAIGCLSMILSFIIVHFIKLRSHILFMPLVSSDSPTEC